jgi:hypothetical protein
VVDPFHWIEQVTGLDPDHGSGILETALLIALVMIAFSFRIRKSSRRKTGKSR